MAMNPERIPYRKRVLTIEAYPGGFDTRKFVARLGRGKHAKNYHSEDLLTLLAQIHHDITCKIMEGARYNRRYCGGGSADITYGHHQLGMLHPHYEYYK